MQINCQTDLCFYRLLTKIISNSLLTKWLILSCLLSGLGLYPNGTLK